MLFHLASSVLCASLSAASDCFKHLDEVRTSFWAFRTAAFSSLSFTAPGEGGGARISEVADLRLGDSGGGSWVRVTTGAAAGAAAAAGTAGTFDFLRLGMPTPTFRGIAALLSL